MSCRVTLLASQPLSNSKPVTRSSGVIKLPILAGKDAFHRVPNFSDEEWDAVERVLTGRAKANRCCHQELAAALALGRGSANRLDGCQE